MTASVVSSVNVPVPTYPMASIMVKDSFLDRHQFNALQSLHMQPTVAVLSDLHSTQATLHLNMLIADRQEKQISSCVTGCQFQPQ